MIDWASGYSSEWRVMKVDPASWGDRGELSNIISITINRDATDSLPLLETADIVADILPRDEFETGWYRIELLAKQGSAYERVSIATMLFQSDSGAIDRGSKQIRIDGYSVLKPAADKVLTVGKFAPAKANGAQFVAELLEECTPAPVVVKGAFMLNDHYVFPIGTSYLEAVWAILDTGGFALQINGDGVITIMPKTTDPTLYISNDTIRLLQPTLDYEMQLSDVPNRYIAYRGGDMAVAINADPNSPVSTVNRKYYVDYFDTEPIPINGESLELYAKRRLHDLSIVLRKFSYTREYYPDVYPFSTIYASLPDEGFEGYYNVIGQTIRCGAGVTVTEKVGMSIEEYIV